MTDLSFHLVIPLAYMRGGIPFGLAVARAFGGIDPWNAGSKNIGATNVGRTSGKTAGIITLAADILKGAVPVFIAFRLNTNALFISLVGAAAFLGHIFPLFLGFKGGKGVATAFGVMIVVSPLATLISAAVFIIVVIAKRYVSLGSIIAAGVLPVIISFFPTVRPFVPMAVFISAVVILRHKDNIKRLASGAENKIY